ncbi:MAG TPA: hypothetical protein VMV97_08320 [Sulfuriferula sp.]|nr:hypothetical protein [Sulfuriferula sp.]
MANILTKIRNFILLSIVAISCFTTLSYAINSGKIAQSIDKAPLISTDSRTVAVDSKNSPVSMSKQRETQELPLIVRIIPEKKTNAELLREENEHATKHDFDLWLTIFSLMTTLFTGVLAWFTIQLATESKRLRELAYKQSEDTRASLAITKRSADAAIALELPIFIIERISIPTFGGAATIEFGNHGRTPATIISNCFVTELDRHLPSKPMYPEQTVQKLSNPRIVDPGKSYEISRQAGPLQADWMSALEGKLILRAYGYVEYFDFLKERRRTGFCLAFTPLPNGQTKGRTQGVWSLEGPSTYTYDSPLVD